MTTALANRPRNKLLAHEPFAPCFNIVLAIPDLAPREHDDALVIQCGHDVFPLGHLNQPLLERRLGLVVHIALDHLQEVCDFGGHAVESEGRFDTGIPPNGDSLRLLDVLGAKLESDGNALRVLYVITSPPCHAIGDRAHTFCSQ